MTVLRRCRCAVSFLILLGLLATATIISLLIGAARLELGEVAAVLGGQSSADPMTRTILLELRVPRSLLAGLVGFGLGVAGAAYQALFRNPLADPFVVGASNGAAFGAALFIAAGWVSPVSGLGTASAGAFLGAIAAVVLVYLIATAGNLPPVNLLLAGAAVSAMLSGLVWLIMALADQDLHRIVGWLMGGLAGRGWGDVRGVWPPMFAGTLMLWAMSRPLDAMCCGEEEARALGLRVGVVVALTLTGASLIVATSVAVSGVIGFVGLVAPHLARPLIGAAHVRLMPASGLTGAVLLLAADTAARSVAAPLELPVGVVTALLGGPFFLLVLRRRTLRTARGQ